MKVIDLTHLISSEMPVYPGTEKPKLEVATTYEKHGFKETLLTFYSHTGTHMDAPSHILSGKKELDEFEIEAFIGKGFVVDCSILKEGEKIDCSYIFKNKNEIDNAEFILFYTGWAKYWGTEKYFGDYPYISDEVVDYLLENNKKGVGFDVIGIDPIYDENLKIHKKLFSTKNMVIIENLTNLDKLVNKNFNFIALPLKYKSSDGAPVRAIAIID